MELNSDTMPRVLVNNRYYATIRRHARSKEDMEFLSDRFQSANWLVRALHQRAETILKVASELVTQQEAIATITSPHASIRNTFELYPQIIIK